MIPFLYFKKYFSMGFFLNESLMFRVPDQKVWVDSDFLKEILCLYRGGQPVKTDLGEFLSLNVALIFDPIPPVCFDGPKYDGILAEQHF
jgi:hypothetical protein